jgi:putative ABC transport system permease protein
MTLFSFLGAIEIGLIFALVALGVFISFRLLRFPDLTVDGSFPLGGAVCAVMITSGYSPLVATIAATLAGAAAGLLTGWLNVKLKIMDLLASILMMIALYSVNLRVMGGPNIPLINDPTLFNQLQPSSMEDYVFRPLLLAVIVIGAKLAMDWFFLTERGLAIRATGTNARICPNPRWRRQLHGHWHYRDWLGCGDCGRVDFAFAQADLGHLGRGDWRDCVSLLYRTGT